ncbi:16041_t:CDS:2, partial [Funneliformis mosseae]
WLTIKEQLIDQKFDENINAEIRKYLSLMKYTPTEIDFILDRGEQEKITEKIPRRHSRMEDWCLAHSTSPIIEGCSKIPPDYALEVLTNRLDGYDTDVEKPTLHAIADIMIMLCMDEKELYNLKIPEWERAQELLEWIQKSLQNNDINKEDLSDHLSRQNTSIRNLRIIGAELAILANNYSYQIFTDNYVKKRLMAQKDASYKQEAEDLDSKYYDIDYEFNDRAKNAYQMALMILALRHQPPWIA